VQERKHFPLDKAQAKRCVLDFGKEELPPVPKVLGTTVMDKYSVADCIKLIQEAQEAAKKKGGKKKKIEK